LRYPAAGIEVSGRREESLVFDEDAEGGSARSHRKIARLLCDVVSS
jgi:hypothetical protein